MGFVGWLRLAAKALVGSVPDNVAPNVSNLLNGTLPGARGEPAPRGTSEHLAAYSRMPWLRAASDRVAISTAAVPWVLHAPARNGRARRDVALQRAGILTRHKMLAELKAAGELIDVTDHPLLDLLQGANAMLTGGTARALMQVYLDLVGEAFLLMERNNAGVPIGIWPLAPHWIRSTPTPKDRRYEVAIGAYRDTIPDSEVLWPRHPDPANPYGRGSGLGRTLADELETDEFAAKHVKNLFYNRAMPDLIVAPKAVQAEIGPESLERLEQRWLEKHRGVWKALKPFFSTRPIDVTVLSQTLESLQFTKLREFERDTIRQVFGVPPEIMGIVDNSNRATIQSADYLFSRLVLAPRLEFMREFLQERLVPEYDDRLVLDYVSPVAEDDEFALKAYQAAPWAPSIDEWRDMQGLPPKADGTGTAHMVPLNLVPQDSPATIPPSPAASSTVSVEKQAAPDTGACTHADPETCDCPPSRVARWALAEWRKAPVRAVNPTAQDLEKAATVDDEFYLLVHRIADRLEPRMRRRFLEAVGNVQDVTVLHDIEAALTSGRLAAAEDAIPWAKLEVGLAVAADTIRETLETAGEAAAVELGAALGFELRFDATNPLAVRWARDNAARLVTEVTESTRLAVRELIERAFVEQRPPRETARLVRDVVGLHSRDVAAVDRFRDQLIAQGVDGEALEKRVAKYSNACLRRRSMVIARTETLNASNMGQQTLWDQAVKARHLNPDRTRKIVVVSPDDRLCGSVCEPMPYMPENQDVKVDGEFTTGDGRKQLAPTFHPQCRCATALVFKRE